ncbi:MAG: D-alanyl-D-alanine carboxypeptidase/D-alanyl-D-alanine-endopeptidase [Bacteroidota bacterium]
MLIVATSGCSSSGHTTSDGQFHPRAASFAPNAALKQKIDALLADSLFPPSNVGMKIVSLTNGEVLYDLNSEMLFTPASNQKLLTSAAALATLGAEYQVTTTVYLDTTDGNRLIVKGGGDPLMSTGDIDSLARLVSAYLPPGRSWLLTGDATLFDEKNWGKGWMWDDEPDPTSMHISPLSVNGNAIKVHIRPGSKADESVVVRIEPETEFVSVQNTAITVADSPMQPLKVTRLWRERSNVIEISGEMRIGDSIQMKQLSVWDPGQMFLALLSERLKNIGVEINGLSWDTASSTAIRIVQYQHRMDSVILYMNRVSDNLSAENILKIMGTEKYGQPGTTEHGLLVVKEYLHGLDIDTTRLVLADGSGLSRYNLLSAGVLIHLLTAVHADTSLFDPLYHSLPTPGEDGSLARRMKGTPAEGRIRAKTGTMSGVSSLSGYAQTEDGETLAFAILMQNFPGSVRSYRIVQDRICILLSMLRLNEL